MKNYKVCLTSKLKTPQSGFVAIEPEDYTMAEVKALKKAGGQVLAYLSVGSVSDEQPNYYKTLKPYQLKRLEDWPHERYIDLRRAAVREWCQKQAKMYRGAGYDGWWLDNIDVYEEYKSTTMFNAIVATLRAIKAVGGYVMINGGSAFLTDLLIPHKVQLEAYEHKTNAKKMAAAIKAKGFRASIIEMDNLYKVQAGAFSSVAGADRLVKELHTAGFNTAKRITLFSGTATTLIDGVTQEEVFSKIKDYEKADHDSWKKGIFTKQEQDLSEFYQAHMRRVKKAGMETFLLEYTRSNTLKLRIKAFCEAAGMTGVCISDDVDL